MTYYLKQKPKLVEPLIRKKIYKIVKGNQSEPITPMLLFNKTYNNCILFYNNYLKEHIFIIITIIIISFFLYYRYNYKLKKDKKNVDVIPNNISYDNILKMNGTNQQYNMMGSQINNPNKLNIYDVDKFHIGYMNY